MYQAAQRFIFARHNKQHAARIAPFQARPDGSYIII
jgi:hypothetical protein